MLQASQPWPHSRDVRRLPFHTGEFANAARPAQPTRHRQPLLHDALTALTSGGVPWAVRSALASAGPHPARLARGGGRNLDRSVLHLVPCQRGLGIGRTPRPGSRSPRTSRSPFGSIRPDLTLSRPPYGAVAYRPPNAGKGTCIRRPTPRWTTFGPLRDSGPWSNPPVHAAQGGHISRHLAYRS